MTKEQKTALIAGLVAFGLIVGVIYAAFSHPSADPRYPDGVIRLKVVKWQPKEGR